MGTLAVDNIQHTDGSSAVTLNNANITDLSAGTIGSGVTFPAGHIIQVKYDSISTQSSQINSGSVDSGMSISITTSGSNNVLLLTFLGLGSYCLKGRRGRRTSRKRRTGRAGSSVF